ncbi:hypothetical protein V494_03259, partial [Pseudogymnoascus sp. VKM F-4513 (FW-928)]
MKRPSFAATGALPDPETGRASKFTVLPLWQTISSTDPGVWVRYKQKGFEMFQYDEDVADGRVHGPRRSLEGWFGALDCGSVLYIRTVQFLFESGDERDGDGDVDHVPLRPRGPEGLLYVHHITEHHTTPQRSAGPGRAGEQDTSTRDDSDSSGTTSAAAHAAGGRGMEPYSTYNAIAPALPPLHSSASTVYPSPELHWSHPPILAMRALGRRWDGAGSMGMGMGADAEAESEPG